ncbi:irregular chiasm C-roughest protein-like isoform X1 [Macrobrachium rosenbergii]|uniref:irregular chiasm C-roughest protein-like isoform X1 n=2 Tax=Macrobrachium rosenbergii TaxID=79674 RepID=UPI0034D3AE70
MLTKYVIFSIVLLLTVTTHITRGMEESRQEEAKAERRKKTQQQEEQEQEEQKKRKISGGGGVGGKPDPKRITWGRPQTDRAYFHPDTQKNITVIVGQKAMLPCTVFNIEQEDVSWIRQRDLHILTVGIFTYTSDDRFKVYHPEKSSDWYLEINPVTFRDAGVYECQVSTSPKIFLPVSLTVDVVQQQTSIHGSSILDPKLQETKIASPTEIFVQNGSTISLTCIVNSQTESVGSVKWFRGPMELDYDSPRGGVSLEVEKTPARTTSKLFLTRATRRDSGNYTCAPQHADPATVLVQVVNGEESAAVQAANNVSGQYDRGALGSTLLLLLLLYHQHP